MRYETAAYLPIKKPYVYKDIVLNFPAEIVNQLIKSDNKLYVEVETSKTEVVKFLDDYFYIGKRKDFKKFISLEVDKKEIAFFTHFTILPRCLEWDREIFSNIIRPQCVESKACPVGAKMLSPVRVSVKKSKRIGIAEIFGPWSKERILVLSPVLKKLFDENGITGLEYERCVLDDGDRFSDPEGAPPYVARVKTKIRKYAEDITHIKYLCSKHKIMQWFELFDACIYEEDLPKDDFLSVDHVMVKGVTYNYMRNSLMITRKVLELLLKNRIRGLSTMCVYLNEKFLPVVLSHREKSPEQNKDDKKILMGR